MDIKLPRVTLTADEIVDLVQRMQGGDIDARNQLMVSQYRRILKMAFGYANRTKRLDLEEDFFQEGVLGLLEGLTLFRFAPSACGAFLNFAGKCALNAMRNFWRQEKRHEIPEREQRIMWMVESGYSKKLVAEKMGVAPKDIASLYDIMVSDRTYGREPLSDMILEEKKQGLTQRQRAVVERMEEGYTQEEIGEEMGISQQAISEHLRLARKKMFGW